MSETDLPIMHATTFDDPFGGALCGPVDGWRTQILSDVTCPECLADPRVISPGMTGGASDA